MSVPKTCESCNKRAWTETMNYMGDIHFYCKKCYLEIQYPIQINRSPRL